MTAHNEAAKETIQALSECLRIAAARGRQIRLSSQSVSSDCPIQASRQYRKTAITLKQGRPHE
ncbi:MAG: hypothetical protein HC853_06090 [Anaerolineae bacterium]|nr:hypothetical protein [Anaerolineae bacterium]